MVSLPSGCELTDRLAFTGGECMGMDDRSKRDRGDARIAARMQAEAAQRDAKPDTTPRCQCGRSYHDGPLYAVERGWREYGFYCPGCLPDDVRTTR